MADTRKKNYDWGIHTNSDRTTPQADAQLAVLMDIRDELKTLNVLFQCANFLEIPSILRAIKSNTAKPRKAKS